MSKNEFEDIEPLYNDIEVLMNKYSSKMSLVGFYHALISISSGVLMSISPTRKEALNVIEHALENGERFSESFEKEQEE